MEELIEWIRAGNFEKIKKISKKDIEEYEKCYSVIYGFPLHVAAECGHTEIVSFLLKKGADVYAKDNNNWTALHHAVDNGKVEIAKLLLENGADIDVVAKKTRYSSTTTKNPLNPLEMAVVHGDYKMADLLIKGVRKKDKSLIKSEITQQALELACQDNRRDIFALFLNTKPSLVNQKFNESFNAGRYSSLFHLAAVHNQREIIRTLVANGADVNILDDYKRTALHYIIEYTYSSYSYDILLLLLQLGANVNTKDINGIMPLVTAIFKKTDEKLVKLLLTFKAHVDPEMLHYLVNPIHNVPFKVLEPIIKSASNVNVVDSYNQTLLNVACMAYNLPLIKLLIECKARISVTDRRYLRSMIYLAACKGEIETIQTLVANGIVDVNIRNEQNQTLLHVACTCGFNNTATINLLIAYKVDLNSLDNLGQTPLDKAIIANQPNNIQLLKTLGATTAKEIELKKSTDPFAAASLTSKTPSFGLDPLDQLMASLSISSIPNHLISLYHLLADNNQKKLAQRLLENRIFSIAIAGVDQIRNKNQYPIEVDINLYETPVNSNNYVSLTFSSISGLTTGFSDRSAMVSCIVIDFNARLGSFSEPDLPQNVYLKVNVADNHLNTPLHYAVDFYHVTPKLSVLVNAREPSQPILSQLYQRGLASGPATEQQIPTQDSYSISVNSVHYVNFEIVKMLLTAGADVNAKNNNVETPLHRACSSPCNNTAVIKLLIDHKADLNSLDNLGQTPLDKVIIANQPNNIQLLKTLGATTAKEIELKKSNDIIVAKQRLRKLEQSFVQFETLLENYSALANADKKYIAEMAQFIKNEREYYQYNPAELTADHSNYLLETLKKHEESFSKKYLEDLNSHFDELQKLLTRYSQLTDANKDYIAERMQFIQENQTYYQSYPDQLTVTQYQELLATIKEHEKYLVGLLKPPVKKATVAVVEKTASEGSIKVLEGRLESFIREQSTLMASWQKAFAEMVNKSSMPSERRDSLSTELTSKMKQEMAGQFSQWQDEIKRLLSASDYTKELNKLEDKVLKDIHSREQRIASELEVLKKDIKPLQQKHNDKQQKLEEQQALQQPAQVKIFYNTLEKILSAQFISAFTLVSGMVQRTETKLDKAGKLGASLLGGLCGGIPVVGGVVGTLVNFGVEEITGALNDRRQEAKFETIVNNVLTVKNALVLAEFIARRLTQHYRDHLETKTTIKQAQAAAQKAAEVLYDYLKSNPVSKDREENIKQLIAMVDSKHKDIFGEVVMVSKEVESTQRGRVYENGDIQKMKAEMETERKRREIVDEPKIRKLEEKVDYLSAKLEETLSVNEELKKTLGVKQKPNYVPTVSREQRASSRPLPTLSTQQRPRALTENTTLAAPLKKNNASNIDQKPKADDKAVEVVKKEFPKNLSISPIHSSSAVIANFHRKNTTTNPEQRRKELEEAVTKFFAGVTKGNYSNPTLEARARAFGYRCLDVKGDGNCFFHAVLDQLKKQNNYNNYTAERLRAEAIQHILDNFSFYKTFIEGDWNEFIIKMSSDGSWADNILIQAMSRALNLTVVIVRSTSQDPTVIKPSTVNATVYLGYIDGLHYQSLQHDPSLRPTKNIQAYINNAEIDAFNTKSRTVERSYVL